MTNDRVAATNTDLRLHATRHSRAARTFLFVFRCSCSVVVALLLMLGLSSDLQAAGDQITLDGHDLQLNVDSRWVGCAKGGYCPIRLRVVNRGPTRTLTFRFAKTYQDVPTVKQTLEVPQNATLAFTLSVPMVGPATSGELRVEDRGRALEKLTQSINLPEGNAFELGYATCLAVSPTVVDFQPFDDGISTFRHATGGGLTSSSPYFRSTGSASSLALPATSLPSSWIDYSGVDVIAVPREELSKLPRDTRTALMQWVRCGGTLLVTSLGNDSAARDAVTKLLTPDLAASANWQWIPARKEDRQVSHIAHVDPGGASSITSPPPQNAPGAWPLDAPFQVAVVGFGKLVTFRDNPFPGTAQDWFWLLKSVGGSQQWDWGRRFGQSARMGNSEFLQFLIPGIGGVPVLMFLVLITIFSVVIGPLNYFVLARRKQLHLLIVTIPVMALATSLVLLGYTTVQHGFGVKARSRSLTFVDQPAQSAVTFNRLSLFAGQAPSSGLQFSRDTAAFPIWPENESFDSGQVDWTETQALTAGWLRSRTRTQFLTVRHRVERGRLEVTPRGADTLAVANGFEWGFQRLVVADEQGRLFVGADVPAGASVDLKPASEQELNDVANRLRENPPELPASLSGRTADPFLWGRPHYRRYTPGGSSPWHFYDGVMEQAWMRLQTTKTVATGFPSTSVTPRSFFGLAAQPPQIEFGVPKVTEIASSHVVMGSW